jgi:hypothetical protein
MMRAYRMPTRILFALAVILMLLVVSALPGDARDRPFSTCAPRCGALECLSGHDGRQVVKAADRALPLRERG